MNKNKAKNILRQRRQNRVRAKISGTSTQPRLSVFRSLKYISAQLIDDANGVTLAAVHERALKLSGMKKMASAREVGKALAKKAAEKNIAKAVFDKGHARFHGRIKELAEGAREGGLKF